MAAPWSWTVGSPVGAVGPIRLTQVRDDVSGSQVRAQEEV